MDRRARAADDRKYGSRRSRSRSFERKHRRHRKRYDMSSYQVRLDERNDRRYSIWASIPSPSPERSIQTLLESRSRSRSRTDDEEDGKKKKKKKKHKDVKKKHKKKVKKKKKLKREDRSASSSPRAVEQSEDDEDEVIGPQPVPDEKPTDEMMRYGRDLLPGEGQAIAQYVQKNLRIPRRGEVGWEGETIEKLESSGYVMSGSRHTAMNAVRIRKENQVYSAEEKKALALASLEKKKQRETEITNEYRKLLTDQLTKRHGSAAVSEACDK